MSLKPWQRRPSPFARQSLLGYVLLVVYGSLYPFSGWQDLGIGPLAYLTEPLPQYLSAFDVVTNVLGYLALGALTVLAVYPRLRGPLAVAAGMLLGALLSGVLEAIQTYLPTRVASNLDLASNTLGALLGAAIMAPATSALLDRGLLRRLRFIWFERHASVLLVLVALWPFAQMFPTPYLFGAGDWPRALWDWLDPSTQDAWFAALPWLDRLAERADAISDMLPGAAWETIVTALNVAGAGCLASLTMRAHAPRVRLLLGALVTTFALKAGATYVQSQSGLSFDWTTQGALLGSALGFVMTLLVLRAPGLLRAVLAAVVLLGSLLLVNLLSISPYFDVVLEDWRQGRYLHFNGLAQWLAWTWPYAALGWLAFRAERAWVQARARKA